MQWVSPLAAQSRDMADSATEAKESDRKFDDLPPEQQKDYMKRVMPLVAVVLVGLFAMLLLWALLRGWRRQRRIAGLGQQETPTEYVDVWSQHKLDESETEPQE